MSEFTTEVKNWLNKVKKRSDFVMQNTAKELSLGVIDKTGVSSGKTKGSWTPAINVPETNEFSGGPSAWERTATGWKKNKAIAATNSARASTYIKPRVYTLTERLEINDTFYLSNSVRYSPQVEYQGWPYTDPYLMMNRTKQEFAAIVAASITKAKGKIR